MRVDGRIDTIPQKEVIIIKIIIFTVEQQHKQLKKYDTFTIIS